MTAHRVSLWTDFACAGGEPIAFVLQRDIVNGAVHFAVGNDEWMQITVARDVWWLEEATMRRVFRVHDALGRVSEWLIDRRDDQVPGGGAVSFRCEAAAMVMRAGYLAQRTQGSITRYSVGAVRILPHQYIGTYVIPALEAAGITWIRPGTVEFADRLDIAFDRWTPRQMMQALAEEVGGEWRLRRDGEDGYLIDLVKEVGAGGGPVVLTERRNLLRLVRQRDGGDLAPVVLMRGSTYGTDGERWGIEHAAWRVAAKSGDRIQLEAHNRGPGPIQFAEQVTGLYALLPDASLTEVTQSDVDQWVTLADASAVSVGDDVVFRADEHGTLLSELTNPALARPPSEGGYGRVAAAYTMDDQRGERNLLSNPFWLDWPEKPETVEAVVAVGGANVVNFTLTVPEAGFEVRAGDVICAPFTGASVLNRFFGIGTGGISDGSGNVSVVLTSTATLSQGDRVLIFRQAGRSPKRWSTSGRVPIMARPRAALSISGAVKGTHSSSPTVTIDGLTEGTQIAFGDVVQHGSTRHMAMGPATVDGAGEVTLSVYPVITASDNADVTIRRDEIIGSGSDTIVAMPSTSNSGEPYLFSDLYTIPHYPGMPAVWFAAGIRVYNNAPSGIAFGHGPTQFLPPSIVVVDGANAIVESLEYDTDTGVGPGSFIDFTLSVQIEFTSDDDARLRIRPCVAPQGTGLSRPDIVTFVRWAYAIPSPDESVPPVDGSHGSVLWQEANRRLRNTSREVATYECSIVDLATMAGFDAGAEAIELGSTLLLSSRSLSVVESLRVMTYELNLKNPADTRVTLDTRPDLLSALTARERKTSLFVSIEINGQKQAVPAADRPAADVDHSQRAVGTEQPVEVEDLPDIPGIVPIEEYIRDFFL